MSILPDDQERVGDSAAAGSPTTQDQQVVESSPQRSRYSRDTRGRFYSLGHQSRQRKRRSQHQSDYLKLRAVLKKKFFEEYLHAFCLREEVDDCLPTTRSTGPLVEMFERVLKKQYRLGRTARRQQMRQFYLDGGHLLIGNSSSESNASPTSLSAGSKKYKGCRLPFVSRRVTEMGDVTSWLEWAASENALATGKVSEAYKICKEVIERYRSVDERPPQQPSSLDSTRPALCSNCNTSLPNSCDRTAAATQGQIADADHADGQAASLNQGPNRLESTDIRADSTHDSRIPGPNNVAAGSVAAVPEIQIINLVSEEYSVRNAKMKAVLDAANNEHHFLMLFLLFDEQLETDFGLFSGVFLEECRREGTEPTELMREILIFSHWRRFGIVDTQEHELREIRLRATMELFEAARIYMGEKPYREMRWSSELNTLI